MFSRDRCPFGDFADVYMFQWQNAKKKIILNFKQQPGSFPALNVKIKQFKAKIINIHRQQLQQLKVELRDPSMPPDEPLSLYHIIKRQKRRTTNLISKGGNTLLSRHVSSCVTCKICVYTISIHTTTLKSPHVYHLTSLTSRVISFWEITYFDGCELT